MTKFEEICLDHYDVDQRVKLVRCGSSGIDGQEGTVVGHFGDFFEIVLFDKPIDGLKASVFIRSCLEKI